MIISAPSWLAFLVAATVRPSLAWAIANDDCDTATSLNIGQRVQSINLFANVEPKCDSATDTANGVFYSFEGNGNIMTATTCGDYTQFPSAVYVSTGCDESCVANEDPGFATECDAYTNGATLTFDSVPGQTYYAQIAGRSLADEGVFEFKVQDYPAPANDVCEKAHKLIVTDVDAEPLNFADCDLTYATKDLRCDGVEERGIWFVLRGTGNLITVSSCFDVEGEFVHDFHIQTTCNITAPKDGGCGAGCAALDSGALQCIATDNPSFAPACQKECGSTQTFLSESGKDYYIIVHGPNTKRTGKVKLAAWQYPPVPHDVCTDPKPLAVGADSKYVSSTTWAGADSITCGGNVVEGRGLWHTFTGTGKVTMISTDHPETDFESEILVLEDCNNDDYCPDSVDPGVHAPSIQNPLGKKFTLDSEKNKRYRIFIYGSDPQKTGNYGLSVEDYDPPANDKCRDAVALTVGGAPIGGTTEFATVESLECPKTGTAVEGRGVWYTFRGSGTAMTVSTCYAETDHPAELYVFEGCGGDCSAPIDPFETFVCNSGFGKQITVDTLSDQFYHVLVAGSSNDKVGSHKISVEKFDPPVNDVCERPVVLTPGATSGSAALVGGTTLGATAENSCNGGVPENGVWYTVAGSTGKRLTVTTCAPQTNVDFTLEARTDCSITTCVQSSPPEDDGCPSNPLATTISWESFDDFSYLVHVSAPVSGNFGIKAYYTNIPTPPETPPSPTPKPGPTPPQNDKCERPVNLIPGNNLVKGTTLGATAKASCDGGIPQEGVWYIVPGAKDKNLTVTTCAPQTNVDVDLEIRTDCNIETCVQPAPPQDDGCESNALASTITWESFEGFSYLIYVSAPVSGEFGIKAFYTDKESDKESDDSVSTDDDDDGFFKLILHFVLSIFGKIGDSFSDLYDLLF